MDIVYENKDIIIVNKPAGKLTQSDKSFDVDLTSEVMTYRRKQGEEPYAAVINRLDRPVSGLVLFAKNKKKAALLSRLLQQETFNKQYYAVVCGKPMEDKGLLVDYLLKDGKNNVSAVVSKDTEGAKEARLEYEVIGCVKADISEDSTDDKQTNGDYLTLIKVHLITGRHHQIRVQLASRGFPIAGDVKYGGEIMQCYMKNNRITAGGKKLTKRNEIALCAYSLTVEGQNFKIEPPFAEIFATV